MAPLADPAPWGRSTTDEAFLKTLVADGVLPVVDIPAEETPEAGAPGRLEDPWEVTAAAVASGASPVAEMPMEDPWEVAAAAAGITSAMSGGNTRPARGQLGDGSARDPPGVRPQ